MIPDDLILTCPECGSNDVEWCNISVRPHCNDCGHWGENNFGSVWDAVSKWNEAHWTNMMDERKRATAHAPEVGA